SSHPGESKAQVFEQLYSWRLRQECSSRGLPPEPGDVRAVHLVARWEQGAFGFQIEERVIFEEGADQLPVLLGLEAARAVNEHAAGFEQAGGAVQQLKLELPQSR